MSLQWDGGNVSLSEAKGNEVKIPGSSVFVFDLGEIA